MNLADSLCLSGGAGPCMLAATASRSIRSCLMWRSRFETKTASEMDRTKTRLWNSPLEKQWKPKSSRPFRVNSVTRRPQCPCQPAHFLWTRVSTGYSEKTSRSKRNCCRNIPSQEQTTTELKHFHSAPTIAKVEGLRKAGWCPVASHGCSNPTSCFCPNTSFPMTKWTT